MRYFELLPARTVIVLWLIAVASSSSPASAQDEAKAQSSTTRPNIIFILADDLGIGDVQGYGRERCRVQTPYLDRLAAEGMRFTDAHTLTSVCVPARVSIMTGRYP